MSLARPGPATFCWGEVWQAALGQLVVCQGIYIVRYDRLVSFIASVRVSCLTAILHVSFAKIAFFFPPGLANDRFHVVDVQRNPAIPSSTLLAPLVSSPCLDANEGIDLWATGSSGCLTLQLCQKNQMWKGELSELLAAKGYWKAVGANLLRVIDETFCSIPTDDVNCCYLDRLTSETSTFDIKLQKKK